MKIRGVLVWLVAALNVGGCMIPYHNLKTTETGGDRYPAAQVPTGSKAPAGIDVGDTVVVAPANSYVLGTPVVKIHLVEPVEEGGKSGVGGSLMQTRMKKVRQVKKI